MKGDSPQVSAICKRRQDKALRASGWLRIMADHARGIMLATSENEQDEIARKLAFVMGQAVEVLQLFQWARTKIPPGMERNGMLSGSLPLDNDNRAGSSVVDRSLSETGPKQKT